MRTLQRKIVEHRLSTGRSWRDMIDMKGGRLPELTESTIPTTTGVALEYLPAQTSRDI